MSNIEIAVICPNSVNGALMFVPATIVPIIPGGVAGKVQMIEPQRIVPGTATNPGRPIDSPPVETNPNRPALIPPLSPVSILVSAVMISAAT